MKFPIVFLSTVCFPILALAAPEAKEILLQNARLAVIGDSITEQKCYSKFIEAYIVACADRSDVRVFQFGWGGERADGFVARAENDLTLFQPTTATLCYGMNDGLYRPFDEKIGTAYETNMRNVLKALDELGTKHIVVGSPGAVDTFYFKRNGFAPEQPAESYNNNLRQLGDIGKKLAEEFRQSFVDVHQPMIDAMQKAKAALGEQYEVCGRDGFHPNVNGHLVMAYAFLKGLGFQGDIGTVTVDLKKRAAVATDGHKVLASKSGHPAEFVVELESTRYPFCFQGDDKSPGGTRSIAPFLPFNQDLNRLTLKVLVQHPKVTVKWGEQAKEFTKEQLAKGINLMEEFNQTPFDENFNNYLNGVANKQKFETVAIKQLITNFRLFSDVAKEDQEMAAAFDTLKKRLNAQQKVLDLQAREALKPVKHSIRLEIPLK